MGGDMADPRARRAALRLSYRLRQFWEALRARPDPQALEAAQRVLAPSLWALFRQMPPNEQAHALRVFQRLRQAGHTEHDLLVAALLHDVGKALHHPRLWERVAVVLAYACCPRRAFQLGEGEPRGWRRPFVLARQHPEWGARLAADAGASPEVAALIRHHQTFPPPPDLPHLAALQAADDQE